jgi:hypothetical protein
MAYLESRAQFEMLPEASYTTQSLSAFYQAVSASDGVAVSEFRLLVSWFARRPISKADLQAYREGRKPWKKLRDEIVPVEKFLTGRYPDQTRIRFPLDDQPPDAWLMFGSGVSIGIEVTAALARARVGIGKSLVTGAPVPGFIDLQDDAPSVAFTHAKSRARILHSRKGVDRAIDLAIASRLAAKNNSKFAGYILLIAAPIGSSPNRSGDDLRLSLSVHAESLPFAEIYVLDTRQQSPIVRLK